MKLKTAKAWGLEDEDGELREQADSDYFQSYKIPSWLRNRRVRIVKESDWQRIQKALELLEKEEGK